MARKGELCRTYGKKGRANFSVFHWLDIKYTVIENSIQVEGGGENIRTNNSTIKEVRYREEEEEKEQEEQEEGGGGEEGKGGGGGGEADARHEEYEHRWGRNGGSLTGEERESTA